MNIRLYFQLLINKLILITNRFVRIKGLNIGATNKNCFLFLKNLDQINGYYFDENSKLPFKDNSLDFIYCSHMVEHLNDMTIINLLKESKRVLKRNKVIRIVTVDFDLLKKILDQNDEKKFNSLNFNGRPEWKEYGIEFNLFNTILHFFANYQNKPFKDSPEFTGNYKDFYRGPPKLDEKHTKKLSQSLNTEQFGEYVISKIPKSYFNNGGHINTITLNKINKLSKDIFIFYKSKYENSSEKKLNKIENFYNSKRLSISIFFEAFNV